MKLTKSQTQDIKELKSGKKSGVHYTINRVIDITRFKYTPNLIERMKGEIYYETSVDNVRIMVVVNIIKNKLPYYMVQTIPEEIVKYIDLEDVLKDLIKEIKKSRKKNEV